MGSMMANIARELAALRKTLRAPQRSEPSPEDRLRYDWFGPPAGNHPRARANQRPPAGSWRTWLMLMGRGAGKTRSGAEWVRHMVETGRARRVALVGATAADVRDVMITGESGILAISPPWFKPTWEPSKRRLTWPNGAIAL